ncbi:cell wall-binding repeat-containing protein [Leucobacter iarius]|uniref:N-acetylmuramoyl-L-alanine amidase n=1 Tax=Leucobacter iarius TaxID=333963 RepID=A0ABN2L9L2_9MICO
MIQRKSAFAVAAIASCALIAGLTTPAWAEDAAPQPVEPQTTAPAETPDAGNAAPESPAAETPAPDAPAGDAPTPTSPAPAATDAPAAAAPTANAPVAVSESKVEDDQFAPAGYMNGTPNKRISGADRFDTAVAVSKHGYPSTASTVIVANGLNYPDALSAGALGAKLKAPLLLSGPKSISAPTLAEIKRLKPSRIIVVGGTGVVSNSVVSKLKGLTGDVKRVAGADRYATSIAIAKEGWPNGSASNAFLATGANFADALSAGAAAGKLKAPVLLVPGTQRTAPAAVKSELTRLGVSTVRIAGGTGAVSNGIQSSISAGRTVKRYAGADRYDTSASIAKDNSIFSAANRVNTYWASGSGFADALAGGAVSGAKGSPLLLSTPSCVPTSIYTANDRIAGNDTFLLGGTGALANTVLYGNECMKKPSGASAANFSGMQWLYTKANAFRYSNGESGFRIADAQRTIDRKQWIGTSAYNWAVNRSKAGIRTGSQLENPKPPIGTIAQSTSYNNYPNRLQKTWDMWIGDAEIKSWLLEPQGDIRFSFSIGYYDTKSIAYASMYIMVTENSGV